MIILLDNLLLHSGSVAAVDTLVVRGLLPTGLLTGLLAGLYLWLTRIQNYSRAEAVMAGFLLLLVVLIVCTIVGVWFRGAEMHLIWPWGQGGG